MRYLTLSRTQELHVLLVILAVLPLLLALTCQPELYDFHLDRFLRPGLEREFGFQAGTITVRPGTAALSMFAVVAVAPEGRLAKAGIRAGDIPVGYKHGFESGFVADLLAVRRGRAVDPRVPASADYDRGLTAWRKIRLDPQR